MPPITTLIELADEGQSFAEIGAPFGLSGSEVGRLLKRADYLYPVADDELPTIAVTWNKKMSLREIGQRIGKHPYYLSKALREAGVKVIRHRYNSYNPLPPDELLLKLYEDAPMWVIAKEHRLNLPSLHARLTELGVDKARHYRTEKPHLAKMPSRARLQELLKSNTPEEIAEMYNVTVGAVYKKATRLPSSARLKRLLKSMTAEQIAEMYSVTADEVLEKANATNRKYPPKAR